MSGIAANLKPEYFKVKDFRLASGGILPRMVVEVLPWAAKRNAGPESRTPCSGATDGAVPVIKAHPLR